MFFALKNYVRTRLGISIIRKQKIMIPSMEALLIAGNIYGELRIIS